VARSKPQPRSAAVTCGAAAPMGTVIRGALARAGVDATQATRLCLADEADAALAALSDKPELQRADNYSPAATEAQDREWADTFNPKILALARGFADALARGFADAPPPDFAKASFAELFAWSLAQPPAE
jgi:hypothetical protein